MSNSDSDVRLIEPEELADVDGAEEVSARATPVGGIISVRIYLEVEGFGTFRAGRLNTAAGQSNGWVKPGVALPLKATPASGWTFSHWTINGLFASDKPDTKVGARRGMRIKAHFEKA